MTDRLAKIRARWANFPRLRFFGHKPTPAQVAGRTDGFDDVAEIVTVDQYATTMSWHDDATPALRDLLWRWSKAPEDVRWLVREVERLRERVAQLEAACLLLDEARSHAVRERDAARLYQHNETEDEREARQLAEQEEYDRMVEQEDPNHD